MQFGKLTASATTRADWRSGATRKMNPSAVPRAMVSTRSSAIVLTEHHNAPTESTRTKFNHFNGRPSSCPLSTAVIAPVTGSRSCSTPEPKLAISKWPLRSSAIPFGSPPA